MTNITSNTDELDQFSELVERTTRFIRRTIGASDGISVLSYIGYTAAARGQGKWIAVRIIGFDGDKMSCMNHTGVYKESVNTTPPSTVVVDGKSLDVFFPGGGVERSFGMFGFWPDGADAIAMFPWDTEKTVAQQNEETKNVLRKGLALITMTKKASHPTVVLAQKALESGDGVEMTSALAMVKVLLEEIYREMPSDDEDK